MQRILAIFLGLSYLVSTTGFTLAKHYCQGELESVSITGPGHCCCEEGSLSDGCCGDEVIQLKVDDQHITAKTSTWQLSDISVALPTIVAGSQGFVPVRNTSYTGSLDPPLRPPAFLSHCSLRC